MLLNVNESVSCFRFYFYASFFFTLFYQIVNCMFKKKKHDVLRPKTWHWFINKRASFILAGQAGCSGEAPLTCPWSNFCGSVDSVWEEAFVETWRTCGVSCESSSDRTNGGVKNGVKEPRTGRADHCYWSPIEVLIQARVCGNNQQLLRGTDLCEIKNWN